MMTIETPESLELNQAVRQAEAIVVKFWQELGAEERERVQGVREAVKAVFIVHSLGALEWARAVENVRAVMEPKLPHRAESWWSAHLASISMLDEDFRDLRRVRNAVVHGTWQRVAHVDAVDFVAAYDGRTMLVQVKDGRVTPIEEVDLTEKPNPEATVPSSTGAVSRAARRAALVGRIREANAETLERLAGL
jgi:hypothetical protein